VNMGLKLFLIWTFILIARPQDFFPFLLPVRIALMSTVLILVVSFLNKKIIFTSDIIKSSQVKKYFLFYCIMVVGVPFAVHRGQSFNFIIFQYFINILYFYFFIVYVDSTEKLEKILFTICLSTFFYAGLCLLNSGSFSGRFSYGTMYDPNDLAYFFVSLFPLSLYFFIEKKGGYKKIIASMTIVSSLVVIAMTGSRGGIIGLLIVLFLLFFTKFGLLRRLHKIILFIILIIAIGMNSEKIDLERYSSIVDMGDDYNVTSEEGRLAVWKRGIELTLIHPITGVGVNCFGVALGNYRAEIGVIPKWQTAHNSYILVLTELGILGFIIFMLMIRGTIKITLGCANRNSASYKLRPITMMSRVIFLAFIGHLVCAFFLSMAYSILFTLFFAFSVVLQNLCVDKKNHRQSPYGEKVKME